TVVSPVGAADIEQVVRTLVFANKARLFPGDETAVEVDEAVLGPPKYRNENRFHRQLTVRFRKVGIPGALSLWLKFRPGLDQAYPALAEYDEKLGGQLLPAPYFAWHSENEETALLASAFIRGTSLRDKLLFLAAIGQSHRLDKIFERHGAKMRR